MERDAWHITMRLENDWVIAANEGARRVAAAAFLRHGRKANLFAFDIPDTHAHAGVNCDRQAAGRFARGVEVALRRELSIEAPFEPARIRPVRSHRHLKSCFAYILGNTPRHGVQLDCYREASNLPDLLGLRTIGRYTSGNVRRLLPRLMRTDLLAHYGLEDLTPGTDARLLVTAAAAAAGVPALRGRSHPVARARLAAAHAGVSLGLTTAQLAEHFELSLRQIQRLLTQPPNRTLVTAVLGQIGLRESLPSAPEAVGVRPADYPA